MRDKALVKEIRGKSVYVVPLISDACIGCSRGSCTQTSSAFPASNPLKLPVKKGSIVKISAKIGHQAFQAFTALLLPIAAAVAAYVLSGMFLEKTGRQPSEGFQAAAVLICLFITAAAVLLITLKTRSAAESIITEIIPLEEPAANSSSRAGSDLVCPDEEYR